MTAANIIATLGLEPHPEGGFFKETFRDAPDGGRARSTAIYYLLTANERSAWHRVDATELWHHYSGDALEITLSADGNETAAHRLGTDLAAGERPQIVVPPHCWQTACSLGEWTLVGCTVAPGFEFDGFEMAPRGWQPLATRRSGR